MSDKQTVKVKANRQMITDNCRGIHGDDGAFDEAVRRLRTTYDDLLRSEVHRRGNGSTLHLTLEVEYERLS